MSTAVLTLLFPVDMFCIDGIHVGVVKGVGGTPFLFLLRIGMNADFAFLKEEGDFR